MKLWDGRLMILGTATRRPGFKYTFTCAYTYGELCACGECSGDSGS